MKRGQNLCQASRLKCHISVEQKNMLYLSVLNQVSSSHTVPLVSIHRGVSVRVQERCQSIEFSGR